MTNKKQNKRQAFTIVELLVVIVVIGILAAITVVSYTGITQKANNTVLISDLSNSKNKLAIYYAEHGSYPTILNSNLCPVSPVNDPTACLKPSPGTTLQYTTNSGTNFNIRATRGNTSYKVTDQTTPTAIANLTCPTGYIPVPGSATYGTNDFCVMKYEAKNVGGVATSQAALTPWVNISQTSAMTTASAACTGCHLITEAEWMTIAQNVLSVPSNWSSGVVGTGYIFSGHNDNIPANTITADTNDSNGYANTGNLSGDATISNGMAGNTQRRTLTLTNGEVIWDMSGNVWEWTNGQTVNGVATQPGIIGVTYSSRIEWPDITTQGSLAVNVNPSGTGINGAGLLNSTNGIGKLTSDATDVTQRGFLHGGGFDRPIITGIFALGITQVPSATGAGLGFRVTK